MPNKIIMVVDDVESNRIILTRILEDRFNVVTADSGAACLQQVAQQIPDLILLDVGMPVMSGYDVCIQLKKQVASSAIPIIFVSAMVDVEERLAGFEAGGDEYVTKPIDADLLLEKIDFRLAQREEVIQAKQHAAEAMQVAMEAMTSSSELGQIIEFVKACQYVDTFSGIGEKICAVASGFGLSSAALICSQPPVLINCVEDSLEAIILGKSLSSKDRVISAGVRTIVRTDQMAILIKDMPIHDDSRYGRFKDHLVVLVSICDGRLLAIKAQLEMVNQRQLVLGRVIKMTELQVQQLRHKFAMHDATVREVMLNMIGELEAKLLMLGLDQDQEEQLMKLAYEASENLAQLKNESNRMEDELGAVLEDLYGIFNKEQQPA